VTSRHQYNFGPKDKSDVVLEVMQTLLQIHPKTKKQKRYTPKEEEKMKECHT
jgi:hypothetical protein